MIQLIGLMIGVYTMFRTIESVLHMAAFEGQEIIGLKSSRSRMQMMMLVAAATVPVLAFLTMGILSVSIE